MSQTTSPPYHYQAYTSYDIPAATDLTTHVKQQPRSTNKVKRSPKHVCHSCTDRYRSFRTPNDLERHTKSVHCIIKDGDKVWKCPAGPCANINKLWPRLDNFRAHVSKMHPEWKQDPDTVCIGFDSKKHDKSWLASGRKPRKRQERGSDPNSPSYDNATIVGDDFSHILGSQNEYLDCSYDIISPKQLASNMIQSSWIPMGGVAHVAQSALTDMESRALGQRNFFPAAIPLSITESTTSDTEMSFIDDTSDEDDTFVEPMTSDQLRTAWSLARRVLKLGRNLGTGMASLPLRYVPGGADQSSQQQPLQSRPHKRRAVAEREPERKRHQTGGRKLTHNNQDDEDSDDERDNGPNFPSSGETSEQTEERLWACPFHKAHPVTNHHCGGGVFRDIPALKQHLYRRHQRPHWHCLICYEVFQTEQLRNDHYHGPRCMPQPDPWSETRMSEQAYGIIKRKKRNAKYDLWYEIFRAIFPNTPEPETPYQETFTHSMVEHFLYYFRSRGPRVVAEMYNSQSISFSGPPMPPLTFDIVQEAFFIYLGEIRLDQQLIQQSFDSSLPHSSNPTDQHGTWQNLDGGTVGNGNTDLPGSWQTTTATTLSFGMVHENQNHNHETPGGNVFNDMNNFNSSQMSNYSTQSPINDRNQDLAQVGVANNPSHDRLFERLDEALMRNMQRREHHS